MLILKGKQGKSRIINTIRHSLRNYDNSILKDNQTPNFCPNCGTRTD